ncbi:transporter substrate-binding domain-containing protein [Paucibacter sp. TC2R-5]|uniref:transporter substrate-binding domain-containing protein n=1 Tax=Paucibacter sp. TC2R-5 TaxID=2893555 RepID=UPI0021E49E2D|nr:transporter substrate-binding domain-containing protein [Paucibacter sp. TC2R-5]MCV2359837.1 transporter substrate-binding domain-containing protein [Paucibacter sp. TC2R-5]
MISSTAELKRRDCLRLGLAAAALPAGLMSGLAASDAQAEPGAVLAAGPADVMADYQRFLNQRDVLQLSDFSGPYSRRDVVEVALFFQALHRGGWRAPLKFQDMPSVERLLRELGSGKVVSSSTSYWSEDISGAEASVQLSQAVIGDGEFEAGFYTVESNSRAMSAKSLKDLQGLSALSNQSWLVDWRNLKRLGIRAQHVTNWELMPKMVAAGRADFLLAPFQATPDLSLQVGTVRLQPIPGLKLGMQGTRHYLISKIHPDGANLQAALNTGLQQLRQQGVIRKAYMQSGFFNPRVSDWLRL